MGAIEDLAGSSPKPKPFGGLFEARVHTVESGKVYVRLTGWQQRFVHGPCRWSRPHPTTWEPTDSFGGSQGDPGHEHDHTHNLWDPDEEFPPPGTRCLVAQSDARVWWIVAFHGWPA